MLPRAKKRLGQNFLVDQTVVGKILESAQIQSGETVLEIGPGTGVLTRALVDAGARVIAIEADKDLIPGLKNKFGERITLIHGDVLASGLDSSGLKAGLASDNIKNFKLVSNIPYNITSSLLEYFLTRSPGLTRMVLMVQKEVAGRIIAKPPRMSLLSVVCQLYAVCTRVAVVKAGAFRPIPKVDSAIVKLDLYPMKHPALGNLDPERVIAIAKRGFSSKRKQLKSNLGLWAVAALEKQKIDARIRAESLTIEQWIELTLQAP